MCQTKKSYKTKTKQGANSELYKKGENKLFELIEKILRDYINDDSVQITETSAFDDFGLDSLDQVQLVMDFEDAFDITIDMAIPVKSVSELMQMIEKTK